MSKTILVFRAECTYRSKENIKLYKHTYRFSFFFFSSLTYSTLSKITSSLYTQMSYHFRRKIVQIFSPHDVSQVLFDQHLVGNSFCRTSRTRKSEIRHKLTCTCNNKAGKILFYLHKFWGIYTYFCLLLSLRTDCRSSMASHSLRQRRSDSMWWW